MFHWKSIEHKYWFLAQLIQRLICLLKHFCTLPLYNTEREKSCCGCDHQYQQLVLEDQITAVVKSNACTYRLKEIKYFLRVQANEKLKELMYWQMRWKTVLRTAHGLFLYIPILYTCSYFTPYPFNIFFLNSSCQT